MRIETNWAICPKCGQGSFPDSEGTPGQTCMECRNDAERQLREEIASYGLGRARGVPVGQAAFPFEPTRAEQRAFDRGTG